MKGGAKKLDWKGFAIGAALGGVGVVIGMLAAKGGAMFAPVRAVLDSLDVLTGWDLLALPVLWLLAIGVHEAGHLFAGLARGMRFLMFVVGPLGLVRAGGRVQFRTYFNLGALAGFAVALPDPARPLRPQMTTMVLGGPLASLALALAAGTAATLLVGRPAAYALVLALLSGVLFLVTAIPAKAGGFLTDGRQFVRMLRDPGFLRRRAHLVALMGLAVAGTRPRQLDPELLARAQAEVGEEAMYDIAAWLYSYHHALDRGDIAAADAWLARIEPAIDQYPDGFRQSLAIEIALFEALHRQRVDVAATWLDAARGGVVDASRRALAQAAVAHAQGDAVAASRHLAVAERQLPRALDPGLGLLSRDQIDGLRAANTAVA